MADIEFDRQMMRRALELAARGQGWVEPNPMVGCVITQGERILGEGWHQNYGGPHAEVNALRAANELEANSVAGSTLYVTLEPCCHHGKTPPCSEAVIQAGVARVVIAQPDPFGQVDGGGIRQLQQAGIDVEVGLLRKQAEQLGAPYLKLLRQGRPWVIGKWAMTLDGKIASRDYDSQWISNEGSRRIVHEIRGRVDAIMVGRETAARDDPRLTARPGGARTAIRIVVDSNAQLSETSHLVRTAGEIPVVVAVSDTAPSDRTDRLQQHGCEIVRCDGKTHDQRLLDLLDRLGQRRVTNVLVEGGGQILGSLLDLRQLDEAHVFIAPKLIGGETAISAVAGKGAPLMKLAAQLNDAEIQTLGTDVYVHGRTEFPQSDDSSIEGSSDP